MMRGSTLEIRFRHRRFDHVRGAALVFVIDVTFGYHDPDTWGWLAPGVGRIAVLDELPRLLGERPRERGE